MNSVPKLARLFVTHLWCQEIEDEFRKLTTLRDAETWLVVDSRMKNLSAVANRYPLHHIFTWDRLANLPYTKLATNSLVGNGHLLLLDFFLKHPGYEHYWFVEYDVRYTDNWDLFFDTYSSFDDDLLTAHLRFFKEEPLWAWWRTFRNRKTELPVERWVRSLNVIYRISNLALGFLERILRKGWYGHHEVLIPTLLFNEGFLLGDLGGDGHFTHPQMINASYTSSASLSGYLSPMGTIRYRPSRIDVGTRRRALYHPVKPLMERENIEERRAAYQRWQHEMRNEVEHARWRPAKTAPSEVTIVRDAELAASGNAMDSSLTRQVPVRITSAAGGWDPRLPFVDIKE